MSWTEKIRNIFRSRKRRHHEIARQVRLIIGDGRLRSATPLAIEQFTYWPLYPSPEYGTPCGDLWYTYTTQALYRNYQLQVFAADWHADDQAIQAALTQFVTQCQTYT